VTTTRVDAIGTADVERTVDAVAARVREPVFLLVFFVELARGRRARRRGRSRERG
jgi:hypothetical protein